MLPERGLLPNLPVDSAFVPGFGVVQQTQDMAFSLFSTAHELQTHEPGLGLNNSERGTSSPLDFSF